MVVVVVVVVEVVVVVVVVVVVIVDVVVVVEVVVDTGAGASPPPHSGLTSIRVLAFSSQNKDTLLKKKTISKEFLKKNVPGDIHLHHNRCPLQSFVDKELNLENSKSP